MRVLLVLTSFILTSGCSSESARDEQARHLDGTDNSIEHQLGEQLNAATSGRLLRDPNAPPPMTNEAARP